MSEHTFTPTTIMHVAMIIRRIRDAHARNKIARDFAAILRDDKWEFCDGELMRLCRYSACVALDIRHRYEGNRCRVCHDGRPAQ